MKTPAIPNDRKSRKTTAAKAVPAKLETLSKRSAAKVFAPKTETTIKPVGMLLERFGHRSLADYDVRCSGVRKPGHHVRCARPWANLVVPASQPLARLIVRRRSGDRPGTGWRRLADGATAAPGIGQRACRRHRVCLRFGSGEALGVQSLKDHMISW